MSSSGGGPFEDEEESVESAEPAREHTVVPTVNFTITLADRVKALGGPPAYAVRRKRIEDLEAALIDELLELPPTDDGATSMYECWEDSLPNAMKAKLRELNKLIDAHNRYYPAEANLPVDVATGELVDGGEPWTKMKPLTWAILTVRSREHARTRLPARISKSKRR